MFIVIEGIDGAGTTTQALRLAEHLGAVLTREPTDREVGRLIRSILRRDSTVSMAALPWLFAADRCDHLESVVNPALERGDTVVSDRYYHSSLAYQSLTLGLVRVRQLNHTFRIPDLTIFLDIPADVALKRIQRRGGTREIFEEQAKLEQISAAYARVNAFLRSQEESIVTLDGSLPMDEVTTQINALMGE